MAVATRPFAKEARVQPAFFENVGAASEATAISAVLPLGAFAIRTSPDLPRPSSAMGRIVVEACLPSGVVGLARLLAAGTLMEPLDTDIGAVRRRP